jgi:hypothetical protein
VLPLADFSPGLSHHLPLEEGVDGVNFIEEPIKLTYFRHVSLSLDLLILEDAGFQC